MNTTRSRHPSPPHWRLVLVAALSLFALATAATVAAAPITSELDDRAYRHIVLDNGLETMLVSDPDTDRAAASLDVAVGHGSDPEDRAGLAHFLEHMLFLGTEKYPEPGEYQEFIKNHGGSHNAYTTYDHTNYFFSVRPEFLDESLDRFAQFFIAPLFNEELVRRERVVVDSEYSARSEDEGRRTLAARRQAMNPAHPRSRFAVGSVETLADREGDPVREDLVRFYNEHYSAHLMKLAVIGRESLDTLEARVRSGFADVRRNDAERFVADVPLLLEETLPRMLEVVPLRERRELSFTFEVPSTLSHYRAKPLHQVANVLGHEGEGSLLAALKARGWASALSAGPATMDAQRGLMEIGIDLTPAGVENLPVIGEMLFDTIRLFREEGIERWRFEEQEKLAEIAFRFSEKSDPLALVQRIADRMHDYPWQEVLVAPFLFEEFDAALIDEYLGYLVPERAMVTLVAPGLATDSTEQWFGTEYAIRPLAPELAARWSEPERFADIVLPGPNPFVPRNLALVADDDPGAVPRNIRETPAISLWHDTDTSFGAPRAEFYFSFRSPRATASAADAAWADLFTEVVEDRLNTFSYPAYLAGLGYEVYPHLRGFSVRVSGFNDRQDALLARIAEVLREDDFDAGRFERIRAGLVEEYRNRLMDSPSSLAVSELQQLLIEDAWPLSERIAPLEQGTLEGFRDFVEGFLAEGSVLALSVGNRGADGALEMASILERTLLAGVEPVKVARSSVVRLAPSTDYERVIPSRHPDSVVGLYKQGDSDSYAERALFYLYGQLSDSAFFNELRTERKLGYVVQSFAMPIINVPGMMFLVQSPNSPADETEAAIRDFIESFGDQLAALEPAAFERARAALLSMINRDDDDLSERAGRYWRELDDEEYEFDSRQRLSRAVQETTIADMHEFSRRFTSPAMSSLVVRADGGFGASGENGSGEGGEAMSRSAILDHASFKGEHAVF